MTWLEIAGWVLAGLLCLVGTGLSLLTISGTWLVLAATAVVAWTSDRAFPGILTLLVFAVLCVLVEVGEFLAAGWGVRRRGGSALAGLAAVIGGILGLAIGVLIPVPILGPLLGALAGSFLLAFGVEYLRLKQREKALNVAWGSVLARLAVMFMKTAVTVAMALTLWFGWLFSG